ncbi:MAG: TetR/AcrR family transcriptional regulator [Pseudomonadota bacterium]
MARRIGSDGARTREAIREAATRLIAQVGYEALSMRRLAEEVGLGAAALYRYYPNKQAMLFKLLDTHMDELLACWAKSRQGAAPDAELEVFTRFHIRHHWPRIDSLFLSYMELRSLTPENFARIEEKRNRYDRGLARILEEGRRAGLFAEMDARVTARAIIALLNGLTTWYRPDGPISREAIEDIYWNMVARVVGAPQAEENRCLERA